MPFPSKDVKMNQKLKRVQGVQVSKPAASGNNRSSIPIPVPNKSRNVPLLVATRSKCQTMKSKAYFRSSGVRERGQYHFLTLLDVSKMNGAAPPVSTILPTEEFVPNSYHQSFHIARWRHWLSETPQWIIKMGGQSLWALTRENYLQTNGAHSNDVLQECEDNEDLGMEEMKDQNESRRESSEMRGNSTEWRDWSLQLTDNNELLITGKTNQSTIHLSRDVSYCKRIDANTLLHADGSVYVLNGMPDHFTNLPYFVRNKFQNGFPDDWKEVKCKWITYVKEGNPYDFIWTVESDEHVLDAAAAGAPAQRNTLRQLETVTPSPRSNISLHVLNSEKTEESHSRAMQDCDGQEKEHLRESQSTRINGRCLGRATVKAITNLNMKEMLTSLGTDESSSDSSMDVPGSSTYPDTVKNPSDTNDNAVATDNNEADVFQNQEIVLERWTPVLVNGCDLKITGYVKSELDGEESHTTEIVKTRKAYNSFQTKNGKTYKLMGTFVDPETTVPTKIKRKLAEGLPAHWKMMMKTWASYASSKEQNKI